MLLSALVLTLFCGCAQDQLQKAIDDFNSKCPMTIAMVARIMDASYENDRVAIRYELDDRLMKIESMGESKELIKKQILASFSEPTSELKKFVDVILAADATLEFVYEGRLSGEKTSVIITPEELKKAQNGEMALSPDEQLTLTLQTFNAQVPIKLAEGMVMTSMQLEGDCVYYEYEVSPEILAGIQANLDNVKSNVRSSLEMLSEIEKADLRKVPAAGKDLGYRYICPDTDDAAEFTFTQSQLKDILK